MAHRPHMPTHPLPAREPSAKYLATLAPPLVQHFELLATAPGGVARLRELILTLAVQGKLVPQDPKDEPASVLLQKIRAEKARLVAEGKIRREKALIDRSVESTSEVLPLSWQWSCLAEIGLISPRNDAPGDTETGFVQMSSIPVAFSDVHQVEARLWREVKAGFTHFAEGDVGVAKITPCFENGKSTVFGALPNGLGAGTTELHVVRPLGGIHPRYVLLFLKTPAFLANGEATMTGSAGQKRLPRQYFEATPFPLPPLAEQARIVARVEELMHLCDALEAKGKLEAEQHGQLVSTLLGTLLQSETPEALAAHWQRVATHFDLLLNRPEAVDALEHLLVQMSLKGLLTSRTAEDLPAKEFVRQVNAGRVRRRTKEAVNVFFSVDRVGLPQGWCVTNVDCIAECLDYARRPVKKAVRAASEGSVPYYGANGQTGWITEHLFDEELVLVVEDETFIGRVKPFSYVVRGKSWVNNHAHVLRPLGGMSADYLDLCLHRYDFIPLTSGTTNRRKLTQPRLLDAELMIAPLAEQRRIVEIVIEIRQICANLRASLSASQHTQAQFADAQVAAVHG